MSPQLSFRLAELLTSRLCHDLITPIGAINTGLELFQETAPDQPSECREILDLILHSAQTASARVSFFRVAFGSSGGKVSLGEARQLIEDYFERSKLEFHWNPPFHQDLTLQGWSRLLLNTVLWMSECAPRGGSLHISTPQEDAPALSLSLKAESIILHQGTVEALEGTASLQDLTPRTVPCYLIHCLVKESQKKLTLHRPPASSDLIVEIQENA